MAAHMSTSPNVRPYGPARRLFSPGGTDYMATKVVRRTLLTLGVTSALAAAAVVPATVASAAPGGPGSWSGLIDWSTIQNPDPKLKGFVAVHLAVSPTGDVLMWDREDGLTTARRWDPNTGAFQSTADGSLTSALFCAFQTRLPGGNLIVFGGTALKKGAGGSELAGTGLTQARIFNWA